MTTTQQKHAPALRFPGFSGKWLKTTIGQNFEFKNGLNKEKEFFGRGTPIINFMDVYHLSAIRRKHIDGFVELSNKEIANFSVRKGDIFFTRTSETISDIGMSATLIEDIENCVFSGFVLRARPVNKKLDNLYKSYCFSIEPVRKEIVTKSSYTTRALTSGRLLKKVCFYYPNDLQEQQKIAAFLSSVDIKIEQLNRKKALLSQYKKGMMQKLFSQEIRFKDEKGKEYPDWEGKKVSEVFKITRGNVLAVNKITTCLESGHIYPVFSSQTRNNGLMGYYTDYLYDNAITWTTDGANAGEVKYRDGRFYCTNVCGVLLSKEGFANQCVSEMLNKVTRKYVSYVGNPKLMNNVMAIIKIRFPSVDEQQKIAAFLSAIDRKIELVSDQLKQAQIFKKGLLQQMFI